MVFVVVTDTVHVGWNGNDREMEIRRRKREREKENRYERRMLREEDVSDAEYPMFRLD